MNQNQPPPAQRPKVRRLPRATGPICSPRQRTEDDIPVIHFDVNCLASDYVKFMKSRAKRSGLIAPLKYNTVPVTPHRNPSCKEGDEKEEKKEKEEEEKEEEEVVVMDEDDDKGKQKGGGSGCNIDLTEYEQVEDEKKEEKEEKDKKQKEEEEERQWEEELKKERGKKKTGRSYHTIQLNHSGDTSRAVQLLVCDFDGYMVGLRRRQPDGSWGRWKRLRGEHMPSWLNSEEIAIDGSHSKKTKIGGSNSIINMFYTLAREDRSLDEIREALLLAVIMFCEALRLYWIWQLIIGAIAGDIDATALEAKYWGRINSWGQLSRLALHLGKYGAVKPATLERLKNKCGYSTIDDIIGPKGDLALLMRDDLILLDKATKELLEQDGAGENIEDPKFS